MLLCKNIDGRIFRVRVRTGKTQVWNREGVRPNACDVLERIVVATNPNARKRPKDSIVDAERTTTPHFVFWCSLGATTNPQTSGSADLDAPGPNMGE